ncbi:hypothetical protein PC121_g18177 [Phytophthora cactorum]|nr:hypothetical protein PC120_g4016 [Phytophthora cactorum]KAG3050826.1 hypothetical protein PC121_g18177 [Phytophthora cactorum]
MVREPGSSGASGFHRESQEQEEEEVSIKLEPRMDASSETGSPTTLLNETGPVDRQSTGRSSADRNKKDNLLEAKPQPLSMPPLEARRVTIPIKTSKKKKSETSRKRLKAPADSGSEGRDEIAANWSEGRLEEVYNRSELQSVLSKNSVMKGLQPQVFGSLMGNVTPPPVMMNKLDTAKATLSQRRGRLLRGKVLFDLDLEVMHNALLGLFVKVWLQTRRVSDPDRVWF